MALTTTMLHSIRHRTRTWLVAATLATFALQAHALIRSDNAPDLVFVLWDPVAQVSYTRDLGLNANDFWAYAQQDKGYSYDYKLDPTDAALVAFRAASTTLANQRWAVFAFDSGPTLNPGDAKAYTTLTQGPDDGSTNPNWLDMTKSLTGDILFAAQEMPNRLYFGLNFAGVDPTQYVRTSGDNATSFDKVGSAGYFAGNTGFSAKGGGGKGSFLAGSYNVANEVNKSSWFYYLTNAAGSSTVVVDEFDNLSSNGYWGLAYGSDNRYRLTFTQAAATSGANSASTDIGVVRASSIDYIAQTGPARLLELDATVVTSVPEPGTWALFGTGLLTLLTRKRRR
ncbi:PEP-CTERM sorting domain-containing protein [Roseateles puraquae]|uniref:Ice-binding protein C-terminal domain-containing protein n=2 Tax=Roseateles puraquae TaxID=431059 RepID=A0A254N7G5_9BURK|nr:PEP-CTERM sorting domain-containing protein [Roseateles puraquae]MDG0857298.1 PEP-CTERM sorting domain-containing protein [Roseateles puraquae]OWR03660.1 hypothetical protein CDO81_14330 [Roseateles puraquae]